MSNKLTMLFDGDDHLFKDVIKLSKNYEIKNFLKDHRIFFLSCITALTLGGRWKINDKDSINTSFPDFIKILKSLGAKIN